MGGVSEMGDLIEMGGVSEMGNYWNAISIKLYFKFTLNIQ